MYRLGVIPAAGKATRFGGTLKELLPISTRISLLSYAVHNLGLHVDEFLVITTPEKILAHSNELGKGILYTFQTKKQDIWGAMQESFRLRADLYYFMMPDTLVKGTFPGFITDDFTLGIFKTDTPERFGCLVDNYVIDKDPQVPTPAKAWGVMVWSDKVVEFWVTKEIETYTQAINLAIEEFGCGTFDLEGYVDFATFEDYKNFLKGL